MHTPLRYNTENNDVICTVQERLHTTSLHSWQVCLLAHNGKIHGHERAGARGFSLLPPQLSRSFAAHEFCHHMPTKPTAMQAIILQGETSKRKL